MGEQELKNRTKAFALRVMKLVGVLPDGSVARTIGNQLIRSGTSIGANYRAACRSRSKAEFIAKLGVVDVVTDIQQELAPIAATLPSGYFVDAKIIRAGQEGLAPVLMTALTTGIGFVPLVLAASEPSKEILYPVATVILGGVISSTLPDFFVHPALFWLFGLKEAQRVVNEAREAVALVEPHEDVSDTS